MINELFGQATIDFFMGILIGIIWVWKKKVIFVLLIIGIVLVIISSFYIGIDNLYTESYPWWKMIFGVVFVALGIGMGKILYKDFLKK